MPHPSATCPAPSTLETPSNAQSVRSGGIDLLRGTSILLVVLHHLGLRIPLKGTALGTLLPHRLLDGLNYNGYESVFVFFVISGFLITANALRRWGALEHIDFRAFYAARISRIAPCLVALLAVLSLLHLAGAPDYVIDREGQSLPGALASAIGLYLNRYEGLTGYLPGNWDVLWSLSIEEAFYLIFPVACLLAGRRVLYVTLLAALALSLPLSHAALAGNEIWQEKAYLPGAAAIATGVLTALWCARWQASATASRACLAAGLTGLLSVYFAESALWKVLGEGTMLVLTTSAALLLIACGAPGAQAATAARRFRSLTAGVRSWGRLSYEIYLTHMFVVYGAVRAAHATGTDGAPGWTWYVAVLPACWLLGLLVERGWSAPCRRWLSAALIPGTDRLGARGDPHRCGDRDA